MFAYCRNNPVSRKDVSGTNDVDCFDSDADPSDDDEEFAGGRMGGGGGSGGNNGSIPVGQANGIGGSGSNSSFSIFSADAVSNGQTGYGQAPPQGPAGTVYTQLSSDGSNTFISQTLYSEYNMPDMRIDYGGHSHGAISGAHIHLFSVYVGPNGIFLNKGPILKCII